MNPELFEVTGKGAFVFCKSGIDCIRVCVNFERFASDVCF